MPGAARRVNVCGVFLLFQGCSNPLAPLNIETTRHHSYASFQKLGLEDDQRKDQAHPLVKPSKDKQYLTAIGHGDLSKGPLICQRVSDMAARAELAKLVRVQIKERAVDRVRERTGMPFEQDIEVVREELVNELLRDVEIVDAV